MQRPIGFGDRIKRDQAAWLGRRCVGTETREAPLMDRGTVDTPVYDQVRDVDPFRPELAREALRGGTQPGLSGGEGGEAGAAAQTGGGAGE